MARVTSRDGTVIAFERTGDGPPVILVDGALGYRAHAGSRPLAAALAGDFTVITYDRRGRGESGDTLPYSVEREIDDVEALIDAAGGTAFLYGFSSGSVLALKAAARLSDRIAKLALLEPPFNSDAPEAKQEFAEFTQRMAKLLAEGRRGDAVAFFFADMLPAEVIAEMRQSPDWQLMESVAHTLAYDIAVLGDGSVPVAEARAATMPTLVLAGGDSPDFKHDAADALAEAMPRAQRKNIEGQTTRVEPDALAPVLLDFFVA